jgi:molybdopterin converting factor small subunit
MITVRLPATLQIGTTSTLVFSEPLATIAELVAALDRRMPGFRDQLDDSVFNFAVNDELLLHKARTHVLADGDQVEIIPAISGGSSAPV